ncbi:unnamed protein product [Amoebophrya sp. A120]|nr:unnamed protein product [Amoebophrya sp. A120]|eukprot:GSA120T00023061001.1
MATKVKLVPPGPNPRGSTGAEEKQPRGNKMKSGFSALPPPTSAVVARSISEPAAREEPRPVPTKEAREAIARMEPALEAFGQGEFVLVMDAPERENECDLIIAAEHCTPAQMAFMIRKSTGIVCVTTGKERLEAFGLHPATTKNTDPNGTNFYVSTDYLVGTTTGVSAADRVATLRGFCDIRNRPEAFGKPGHMFPLCAKDDGVYVRQGHTEATFDFCRLAPNVKHPVGALAELMADNGEMFREGESRAFATEHGIPMVYVSDIVHYRRHTDAMKRWARLFEQHTPLEQEEDDQLTAVPADVKKDQGDASATLRFHDLRLPTRMVVKPGRRGSELVLLIAGDANALSSGVKRVPVRIHSECFTGDTLGSRLCDCGAQLKMFMKVMEEEKLGVLVYIKGHEGRGIGLYNKIRAYDLQICEEVDTVQANHRLGFHNDYRNFDAAVNALRELNLRKILLYTNNPEKESVLAETIPDVQVRSLPTSPNRDNFRYLETKKNQLQHRTIMQTFNLDLERELNSGAVGDTLERSGKLARAQTSARAEESSRGKSKDLLPGGPTPRSDGAPDEDVAARVSSTSRNGAPFTSGPREVLPAGAGTGAPPPQEQHVVRSPVPPEPLTVLIVSTKWNEKLLAPIVDAAREYLAACGARVECHPTAGHLDLVTGTKALLSRKHRVVDAVIVLGMLVPNEKRTNLSTLETDRAALVQGLMSLALQQDKPIIQGILLCEDEEHAQAKGMAEGKAYANSALYMAGLQQCDSTADELHPPELV